MEDDGPHKLSVVIPTLNAARALGDCLAALACGAAPFSPEIVVSDGGSEDTTRGVAEKAGAPWVSGSKGRGGQLRRGADRATGDWLLFLHADTHLPADWGQIVARHISQKGGPAAFRLRFRASGVAPAIVARWANLRSRMGLPYGDQGLLVSRQHYDRAGGFADMPLMEDVELAGRLPRITLLPGHVTTSAERYIRDGWLSRSLRNGGTFARYLLGVSPEELAQRYERVTPRR